MNKVIEVEDYPWLDPNHESPVTLTFPTGPKRMRFGSVQAAYQAQKCPSRAKEFVDLTPTAAWTLGREVERASTWNHDTKRDAMRRAIRAKFAEDTDLTWKLISLRHPKSGYAMANILADYGSELSCFRSFGSFWGTRTSTKNPELNAGSGKPQNMYGFLLKSVRGELLQNIPKVTLAHALVMTSSERDADTGLYDPLFIRVLGADESARFEATRDEPDALERYPELAERFDPYMTYVVRISPVIRPTERPSSLDAFEGLEFTVY